MTAADDNLECLRAVYSQWERGNFQAGGELFANDIVYEPIADGRESFVGREAVNQQMREFLSQWSEFRVEARDFVQAGDLVVVTERQLGTGKSSGIAIEMAAFAVWTFRDGVVVRVRWETDRALAFGAAGVQE